MKRRYGLFISLITVGALFIPLNVIAQSERNLNEAFLKAVYAKNIALMEKLLKDGADINVTEKNGLSTPLSIAAGNGDLEVVSFLLSKGANPQGVQALPNFPIYLAISKNHPTVVNKFLDVGISPNYAWTDRNGGTLLITAVQLGNLDIVKLLIQRGADVNFTGNGDYSPLYRSIIYDYFSTFEFLVSKGACLNERDKAALSELEWEKTEQDKKYIQILEQHQKCSNKK